MVARIRMRDGGGVLRTINRIRMRDAGGTLRTIQRVRMRDAGGTLRTVYQYLSVALSAPVVTGSNSGAAAFGSVTSSAVTATVTGGTPAFTYLWEYVSGDATIAADTPTAASTTFTSASVFSGGSKEANFRLKVTDSTGAVVYSSEVQIQLYWADTR